jgi:hypothetical protein
LGLARDYSDLFPQYPLKLRTTFCPKLSAIVPLEQSTLEEAAVCGEVSRIELTGCTFVI